MFENLTDKLQRAFKTLRGQGTLTEENIAEALREIRVALLEADVNLNVARGLIEGIRAKAVNSLRGEGDKAAVAEELSGAVDFAESDGWGHRRF